MDVQQLVVYGPWAMLIGAVVTIAKLLTGKRYTLKVQIELGPKQ
jgi:hypothetical protein